MTAVSFPPGVTQAQLDALDTKVTAGLTSMDRQQAIRVQLTPDANGRIVYVYPRAYTTGSIVAAQTTAETPNGVAYRNDASIEENSATTTQVVILVQRVPKTLTVALLNSVVAVLAPVTTPVWLNIFIRATA